MVRSQKRLGYLLAVVGCAIVLAGRMALNDVLAEQARLLPFVLAVTAAAWWGGLGPGILATLLGAFLGVLFVVPPPFSLQIDTLADGLNAAIFVFTGVTISILCDALHTAWRRETEKQFQTLADSMPQLVWMARPDGYRFWFNRRWYEYTGARPGEIKGFDWPRYCGEADGPRVIASWHSALGQGTLWEETYPLRRADGQMRWHLARAVPVRDDQHRIMCWFGTSTDIQDRIAFEDALKDADAHKDQFLATLAHELRNPLSAISNATELWPHVAGDKAEMANIRGIIERQVRHLIRLIDDLMDLSRITQGKVSLRRQPTDLAAVITAAVETVQPAVEEAEHRLTVNLPEDPLYVDGDAARLRQVFGNILHNAVKYTVRHGVISVTLEAQDGQALVHVRDNGPGIPAAMLEDIFLAFHQVDTTLGRSHGGLGIGLWLARQLVEQHGGSIEAHSEGAGRGSEFVVMLPLTTRPNEEVPARRPRQRASCERVARDVLVVDDMQESAETLVLVLRSLGHHATALGNGKSAVEWILAHRPEVVLLDIAMPGLDGYEVARRVREHPELGETVLVALTGHGQPDDRRKAFEAGFNSHLTKPTSISMLRDLLDKLPRRRDLAQTAGA